MKNNLKNRTLLERGGLMIEALAMLGLIAVVTPTMYKKSAERTMEVDDINTATTIRSYVNAAESYMATNYVPLMKEFQDAVSDDETPPTEQYKPITNQDLADFLPYKFKSASSLYDYNEPKVTVVKNGNNLTAFLLFPAKGAGDDGLGQERTARIASLVGANGGYVRSQHNARGIGGIWSLNGDTYTDVFSDDDSPVYSIVASTPNAINGSTQIGEFENPKYLQRTFECPEDEDSANCTDERWRNTMRTDLYLGGYSSADELPEDNPSDEKMHNIRNIGSLIVGAEDQVSIDGTTSYGLYIAEDIDNAPTTTDSSGNEVPNKNAKSNAYIGGSLMAGLRNFFVDKDNLNYGPRTKYNSETGEDEDDGYNFVVDSGTGKVTQYGDLDLARNFYRNDGSTEMPNITIGSNGDSYSNVVIHAQRYDNANHNTRLILLSNGDEQGLVRLDTSGTYDAFSDSYCPATGVHGGSINIAKAGDANINKKGKVAVLKTHSTAGGGTGTVRELQDIPHINYRTPQNFPVAIGENTYVQGLLAADQLDTQKLRTASLSTGSKHVDDEFQWLNVDQYGVVIESTDGQRPTTGNHTTNTEVHVDNSGVSMRFGGDSNSPKAKLQLHSDTYSNDGHGGLIPSPTGPIRDDYAITGEAKNITFETENEGFLSLQNDRIVQTMTENQIDIGFSSPYREDGYSNYDVNYTTDGVVNLVGANLRAGYIQNGSKHNVLSVNTQSNFANQSDVLPDASLKSSDNNYPEDFSIAMHGNVLFTDGQSEVGGTYNGHNVRYMSIGQQTDNTDSAAAVEITGGDLYSSVSGSKVVVVDLSGMEDYYCAYGLNYNRSQGKYEVEHSRNEKVTLSEGSVYIRKGAIDVLPKKPTSSVPGTDSAASALNQTGFIAAPRFVANNRDANGDLVKVPDLIMDEKYKEFNGAGKAGRYDTYMVNPAYTSVMHDIKLTTRGGARLSDILPNFIIKGIYLSTNDKDDSISDFTFKYDPEASAVKYKNGQSWVKPTNNTSIWASPYTGYVPKPQCPPGYLSVITFTPVSMYMAQAGQLGYNSTTGAGANHYAIEEDFMTFQTYNDNPNKSIYTGGASGRGDEEAIKDVTPMYRRAKLKLGEESEHSMTLSTSGSSYSEGYSDIKHYVSDVTGLEVAGASDSFSSTKVYPYVLTAGHKDNNHMPFVFQQNTWLKTLSIPLCNNNGSVYKGSGRSQCDIDNKYINSWALLMGFVYLKNIYAKYLEDTSSRIAADNYLYWNVFPVTKGSLEGTATTYCYFDRSNLGTKLPGAQEPNTEGKTFENSSDIITEDKYISLGTTTLPTTYKKSADDAYIKRLNDPTLKYTEEW